MTTDPRRPNYIDITSPDYTIETETPDITTKIHLTYDKTTKVFGLSRERLMDAYRQIEAALRRTVFDGYNRELFDYVERSGKVACDGKTPTRKRIPLYVDDLEVVDIVVDLTAPGNLKTELMELAWLELMPDLVKIVTEAFLEQFYASKRPMTRPQPLTSNLT